MDGSSSIDHLVLGVDDGDYSWSAIGAATAVADSVAATLHVVHAGPEEPPPHLAQRAADAGVVLRSAPTAGDDEAAVAAALIADGARLANAVVALTSHARGAITAALMGSTARAVIQQTAEPVLLFGPHSGAAAPVSRVLACVDGSKLSETILPTACRWARAAGVPLWVLHVVEPDMAAIAAGADTNYVHRVAEDLAADGLDIQFDVLHGDDAGEAIAAYADQQPGTITALATHGRTGLRDVTMGSVALEVTRRSQGPTLVMRPR